MGHFGHQAIILVTKDIMVRVKAILYGIETQDYENDKVLDDADILPSGIRKLPKNFWEKLGHLKAAHSPQGAVYVIETQYLPRVLRSACINEFVHWDDAEKPFLARVIAHDEHAVTLRTVKTYDSAKASVLGIRARNPEQAFALGLLLDPEVDFVTLLGQAGTGKTLRAALLRDHLHAGDGTLGERHRLPPRHRRREDEPVDGRARRQPRSAPREHGGQR